MAPTATGNKARWAPPARRVWAGAGPQRARDAYRGGAYRGGLQPTACYTFKGMDEGRKSKKKHLRETCNYLLRLPNFPLLHFAYVPLKVLTHI